MVFEYAYQFRLLISIMRIILLLLLIISISGCIQETRIIDGDTMLGFVPGRLSREVHSYHLRDDVDLICFIEQLVPSAKPWNQLFITIEGRLT